MFAAESFEDLSNELVLKNIDGESSSRLQSASESSDAIYNDGGLCFFCIVGNDAAKYFIFFTQFICSASKILLIIQKPVCYKVIADKE